MKKRIGAFLCVLLLLLNLTVPLAGASANSSNLPPVGWAETVSSFLMACGIYPFETDEDGNYTEWSVGSLVPLWNQFREDVSTVTSDIRDMAGYLVNGVIAIASGRWSVLREFASWIVNKFNVTDNQTRVELGTTLYNVVYVPYFSSGASVDELQQRGLALQGTIRGTSYFGASVPGTLIASYDNISTSNDIYMCLPPLTLGENGTALIGTGQSYAYPYGTNNIIHVSGSNSAFNLRVEGAPRWIYLSSTGAQWYHSNYDLVSQYIPVFSNQTEMVRYFYEVAYLNNNPLSGITADTTTVSIPAPLPDDTQYGGLTVAGAGAAVTVEALTEIVQEAVIEGLKPIVNTLLVNLSPDIEVNPDSGEITQGEITITPADIDLVSSDYQIRQLHTVFPFSIPWDVANIFLALNAEPVRPYWEVSLTLPGILGQPDTQIPFVIGVSDDNPLSEVVDNFAALMRNFLLVLMCVGTLVLFFKR